jgi:hypothetical protein
MAFDAEGLAILNEFLALNDALERAWATGGPLRTARSARSRWLATNEFRLAVALRRLMEYSAGLDGWLVQLRERVERLEDMDSGEEWKR